jgi:hypothetical protein
MGQAAGSVCCSEENRDTGTAYYIGGSPTSYAYSDQNAAPSAMYHDEADPKVTELGMFHQTSGYMGRVSPPLPTLEESNILSVPAGFYSAPATEQKATFQQTNALQSIKPTERPGLIKSGSGFFGPTQLEDPRLHKDEAALEGVGAQGYAKLIAASRAKMRANDQESSKNSKYMAEGGKDLQLPKFEKGRHVPTLALINGRSGGKVGSHVLAIARGSPVYQDRFFDIVEVAKDTVRGGLLDVFRLELNAAKEEAKAIGTRPRVISGGGDGTGSFTLHMILKALQADNLRDEEEGLRNTGNGFIWTDEELRASFPAIAQMPLGSANDFANILGWGQTYPGSANGCFSTCANC